MVNVIAVVAAKGGVGKSTVAASLGVALRQAGQDVLAVDLSPQNALHLHLGGNPEDIAGLSRASVGGVFWRDVCMPGPSGMSVLPFGQVDETDLLALERRLAAEPNWLSRNLQSLGLSDDTLVILDTPTGPSEYLRQALSVADLVISVMLADAASYATLPMIENMIRRHGGPRIGGFGHICIINQFDGARSLSRDTVHLIHGALGERVIGVVHEDQFVREALACGRTVIEADSHSLGRNDLVHCADWVGRRLHAVEEAAR